MRVAENASCQMSTFTARIIVHFSRLLQSMWAATLALSKNLRISSLILAEDIGFRVNSCYGEDMEDHDFAEDVSLT